jgi:DNA methylase
MRRPIENNSSPGQALYDPFSGSGTTLIAGEMTGRSCLAIDIDPAYVDVDVLAQLARLEVGFGDFTRIGVSRINRLVVAEGGFGRVVTTLGIFFRGGSSCDGACICATRFAGRTARFTVIGAWFAAFV